MASLILIVDDEPDLVNTLEYNLEREGYLTRSALTGQRAVALALMEPVPDLVLLDVMLPDIHDFLDKPLDFDELHRRIEALPSSADRSHNGLSLHSRVRQRVETRRPSPEPGLAARFCHRQAGHRRPRPERATGRNLGILTPAMP